VFISVKESDKPKAVNIARELQAAGLHDDLPHAARPRRSPQQALP
jgi:hypothetical protein